MTTTSPNSTLINGRTCYLNYNKESKILEAKLQPILGKKQPSKKAQRQEAEVPQDEVEHEESVPTPSNDPQPSEEDPEVRKEKNVKTYRFEKTQESCIKDIDADVDVSLVDETQEKQDDDLMFDTGVLEDDEMNVEAKVDGKDEHSTKPDDSTAGEAVTTTSVDDSAVPTTIEEITLAQTLTD
ncbi:hypothetical protein Tco_0548026 [Tanacetum coccineum]